MRAKDLMSHPVVTVAPQTSVRDAAALLSELGFTALPVIAWRSTAGRGAGP
jgi:CBS domain-containing protein